MEYPLGWVDRVEADRRQERIGEFGWILYTDWMTQVLMRMIQTDVVAQRPRVRISAVRLPLPADLEALDFLPYGES